MVKIPYMIIIGDQEVADNTLSVRLRSGRDLRSLSIDQLTERLRQEITQRKDILPT